MLKPKVTSEGHGKVSGNLGTLELSHRKASLRWHLNRSEGEWREADTFLGEFNSRKKEEQTQGSRKQQVWAGAWLGARAGTLHWRCWCSFNELEAPGGFEAKYSYTETPTITWTWVQSGFAEAETRQEGEVMRTESGLAWDGVHERIQDGCKVLGKRWGHWKEGKMGDMVCWDAVREGEASDVVCWDAVRASGQ